MYSIYKKSENKLRNRLVANKINYYIRRDVFQAIADPTRRGHHQFDRSPNLNKRGGRKV